MVCKWVIEEYVINFLDIIFRKEPYSDASLIKAAEIKEKSPSPKLSLEISFDLEPISVFEFIEILLKFQVGQ